MVTGKRNHFWPPRLRGFTLIELLVVVGVIGVLLGLLLPNLRDARRKAKITQCVSNYRQIGATLFSYANDYEGNFFQIAPNATWNWAYSAMYFPATADIFLPDILAPYSGGQSGGAFTSAGGQKGNMTPGNFKIWNCPFTEAPPIHTQTGNHIYINQAQSRVMMNLNFSYSRDSGNHDEPVSSYRQIPSFPLKFSNSRTDLPLAQDLYTRVDVQGSATGWYINHSNEPNPTATWSTNPSFKPNLIPESQGFGATVLFYDGSARHVTRNDLVRVDWNALHGPLDANYTFANKSVLSN